MNIKNKLANLLNYSDTQGCISSMRKALTELDLKKIKRLESGSIFGSRETMAYNDNPALLYSIYKDGLTPFSDNTNGYSSVATIIDF